MWKLRWGSPSGPSSSPACPCDLVSLARVPFRLERGLAPLRPGPLTLALSPDGERGILRVCGFGVEGNFANCGVDGGVFVVVGLGCRACLDFSAYYDPEA